MALREGDPPDLVALHECARRSYGDLLHPTFHFVQDAVERQPYARTAEAIRRAVDRFEDLSDWNDDVAFRYVVKVGKDHWVVLLSLVGPVACVHRGARPGEPWLKAADFVTAAPPGNDRLATVIDVIEASGFHILDAQQVAQEMTFNPIGDVGPCPVFRVFFTDLDDDPWREDGFDRPVQYRAWGQR